VVGCRDVFVLCAVIGRDRNNEISKACFFETSGVTKSFWNSNQDRPTFAAGHQYNPQLLHSHPPSQFALLQPSDSSYAFS
jgi:hypothetical protein